MDLKRIWISHMKGEDMTALGWVNRITDWLAKNCLDTWSASASVSMEILLIPLPVIYREALLRNVLLTSQIALFNVHISEMRVAVEWMFRTITNNYKFTDLKQQLKVGLCPIGTIYLVCVILQNAHTCLNGNIVFEYFVCQPPDLHDYFW